MIVVDVETTGLDENRNSIVSIGAVEFENPSNQFYRECKMWGGATFSDQALNINGFTQARIMDISKPLEGMIVEEYIDWGLECNEITLAGENPSFDMKFLMAAMNRHNKLTGKNSIKWPFGYRSIDVHTLCWRDHLQRGMIPPTQNKRTNISLDSALVYVGMPPEPMPHNALTGAKLEAEVISRMLHGKSLFQEYAHFELPAYLK